MAVDDQFADVARQRNQLGQAMRYVELAIAAPIGKPSWIADFLHALNQLDVALSHHAVELHAPKGVFDLMVEEAPRLQRQVESMREGHDALITSVQRLLELTAAAEAGDGNERESLRDAAVALLVSLTRHRQRGADLLYEAYDVDIGGY